jgi:hypothetical protein
LTGIQPLSCQWSNDGLLLVALAKVVIALTRSNWCPFQGLGVAVVGLFGLTRVRLATGQPSFSLTFSFSLLHDLMHSTGSLLQDGRIGPSVNFRGFLSLSRRLLTHSGSPLPGLRMLAFLFTELETRILNVFVANLKGVNSLCDEPRGS